ncbi:MAG: serine hydrolase domain-containing protein [Bacteroidota bacterium]
MTQRHPHLLWTLLLATGVVVCALAPPQAASAKATTSDLVARVNAYVEQIQATYGIPGIALAIVKNGEVVYKDHHGYANLEHQVPVTEASIFRLYSLSKVMVAVSIFQLIEEGQLSLEAPIGTYLPDVPEGWRGVQVQHLLTHSSGLPDVVGRTPQELQDYSEADALARVVALPVTSAPGRTFDYNQTNFWLLQRLIETITGTSLHEAVIGEQFPKANAAHVFFSTDSRDVIRHRATPYFPFLKGTLTIDHPHTSGTYLNAASGLHLRLDDLIGWDRRFRNGELLNAASKERMWAPFAYTASDDLFTHSGNRIAFNDGHGYGFSGSLSTIYYTFPDEDLSIIFLSNGLSTLYNMKAMILDLAALTTE